MDHDSGSCVVVHIVTLLLSDLVKFEKGGYPKILTALWPFLLQILAKLWFPINIFYRSSAISSNLIQF